MPAGRKLRRLRLPEGRAPVNGCPVGGAAAAEKIAKVLGVEVAEGERNVAHVKCNGGCNAVDKAVYEGLQDCNAAMRVAGGPKACAFGCMGLGSCVKACAFDAIHIVDGVAKVDVDKCVACGKCVSTCPKKIIDLIPVSKKVHVNCVNKDKGPEVMKVCSNGCIEPVPTAEEVKKFKEMQAKQAAAAKAKAEAAKAAETAAPASEDK